MLWWDLRGGPLRQSCRAVAAAGPPGEVSPGAAETLSLARRRRPHAVEVPAVEGLAEAATGDGDVSNSKYVHLL